MPAITATTSPTSTSASGMYFTLIPSCRTRQRSALGFPARASCSLTDGPAPCTIRPPNDNRGGPCRGAEYSPMVDRLRHRFVRGGFGVPVVCVSGAVLLSGCLWGGPSSETTLEAPLVREVPQAMSQARMIGPRSRVMLRLDPRITEGSTTSSGAACDARKRTTVAQGLRHRFVGLGFRDLGGLWGLVCRRSGRGCRWRVLHGASSPKDPLQGAVTRARLQREVAFRWGGSP